MIDNKEIRLKNHLLKLILHHLNNMDIFVVNLLILRIIKIIVKKIMLFIGLLIRGILLIWGSKYLLSLNMGLYLIRGCRKFRIMFRIRLLRGINLSGRRLNSVRWKLIKWKWNKLVNWDISKPFLIKKVCMIFNMNWS